MQETPRGQAQGHEGLSGQAAEGETGQGKAALSLIERVEAQQTKRVRTTTLAPANQKLSPMLAKVFEQIDEMKR